MTITEFINDEATINDAWPDLSGWHPLPEGGTIPEGMRYAWRDSRGDIHVRTEVADFTPPDSACYRFCTERPVPVPLPTEEGARIIAQGATWIGAIALTLAGGEWRMGYGGIVPADSITRWMPATEWRVR